MFSLCICLVVGFPTRNTTRPSGEDTDSLSILDHGSIQQGSPHIRSSTSDIVRNVAVSLLDRRLKHPHDFERSRIPTISLISLANPPAGTPRLEPLNLLCA